MPTVKDILICDEVRDEANGKKIFLGVYGDDLVLGDIPAEISKITFIATIAGLPKGQTPIKFVFESPSGKAMISGDSNVDVLDPSKPARIIMSVPNPLFIELGDYPVKIGFGKSQPRLCHTLTVKLAPKPAPPRRRKSSTSSRKKRSSSGAKS